MKQLLFCLCALTFSCFTYGSPRQDNLVIKETFRNNYGIIVSGKDWVKRGCDGTITKVLKDGSILYEVYTQGLLHGEITLTFPHSTTLASVKTYDQGRLLSNKTFFSNGLPSQEELFHEDGSLVITRWPDNKNSDTISDPYFIETTHQGRVIEGNYLSYNGKYSSSIHQGEGIRSVFSSDNVLLSEELFADGLLVKKTTFYPTRDPETVTHYTHDGQLHGLRCTYLPGGIPDTIEEWRYGHQDGTTILFKNGCKVAEVPFIKGTKNGLELRYNEHDLIAEEISWKNNVLHGMRKIYAAGVCKCEWYHRGRLVSKDKYDRLNNAG